MWGRKLFERYSIRSRAPLRLGLAGGGTDLSPYCDRHGGAVLNATIDRFAFAHLSFSPNRKLIFRARDVNAEEAFDLGSEISVAQGLVLHKAVYRHFVNNYIGEDIPVTISTTIDAPAGSGLGSSSALVVALVEAFRYLLDLPLGPYDLAKLAYDIERVQLQLAGGRQDQYAASFGGINFIEFLDAQRVIVNPLRIKGDYLKEFESSIVICFTGQSRRSEVIIREQVCGLNEADSPMTESMHRLKDDASAMKVALLQGNIADLAQILRRSWETKKKAAAIISTPEIDRFVDLAMKEGAMGGKVSGAGGGGFLMLMTDPENRYRLISKLNETGGQASAVKLTFEGVEAWSTQI